MLKNLLIILISSLQLSLFANPVDSLYQLYKSSVDSNEQLKLRSKLCYELSFSDVQMAQSYAKEHQLSNELAYSYLDRGDEFMDKGFFIFASQFYEIGLDLFKTINDTIGRGHANNNIGLLYLEEGELSKAKKCFQKALDLFVDGIDDEGQAMVLLNQSTVKRAEKKFEEAHELLKSALRIHISLSNYHEIVRCLNELGGLSVEKGDLDKAKEFYEQSLTIIEELKDESYSGYTYNQLAHVYFLEKNYDKCISIAEKSILLKDIQKAKEDDRDAYHLISDSYFALGLYENAYRNYVIFEKLEKQLKELKNVTGLSVLKSQLETQSQDKQALIEKEIKRIESSYRGRDNLLYVSMFVLIGVLAGLIVYLFSLKRNEMESHKLLVEVQSEIERIVKEQEEDHYEMENKLLSINSLNAHLKNEILSNVETKIDALLSQRGAVKKGDLKEVVSYIHNKIDETNDWVRFKSNFEKLHGGFFDRIENRYPGLTPGDLKLCAFIRVQLDTKDIAALLGITSESVVKKRNRLRKRLDVNSETDLQDYMMHI